MTGSDKTTEENSEQQFQSTFEREMESVRNARLDVSKIESHNEWIILRSLKVHKPSTNETLVFGPKWGQQILLKGDRFEFDKINYSRSTTLEVRQNLWVGAVLWDRW
jgi:hypothetical protein